jgi:hypothetical protein
MIHGFSRILTAVFDGLVLPFGDHRGLALAALSLLTGVAMIFLFKATSDQERIRRVRARFSARILEMRIYPDDIWLILRALGGALWENVAYLRASAKPIVVLILLIVPVFIQLDERYGRAALAPGANTLVTVTLKDGLDPMNTPVSLAPAGNGIAVDSRPVRVRDRREIAWRLRVAEAGVHPLRVEAIDKSYELPIFAQASNRGIGHTRRARSRTDALIHPTLPAIPPDSPFAGVNVRYASTSYSLFGWHTHWLVVFVFWSLVGAAIPKFVFRIQV